MKYLSFSTKSLPPSHQHPIDLLSQELALNSFFALTMRDSEFHYQLLPDKLIDYTDVSAFFSLGNSFNSAHDNLSERRRL